MIGTEYEGFLKRKGLKSESFGATQIVTTTANDDLLSYAAILRSVNPLG